MDKIIFGRRLKAERIKSGYTQEELSLKLKVSKTSITMYEQGKRFPRDTVLSEISKLLNVSIDYLMGTIDNPKLSDAQTSLRISSGNAELKNTSPSQFIPMFESAAAGVGAEPLEQPVGYMSRPQNSIGDMWVTIRGNSMEPRIYDGDQVLVDKSACIKNGDPVVAIVDGKVFCKYYYEDDDGKITLYSQTAKYPPMHLNTEIQFIIIGKVVGFFGKM